MKTILKEYIFFLEFNEKKKYNTIISVKNDLEKFLDYFFEKKIDNFNKIDFLMLREYFSYIKSNNFSSTTYNRKISSIKKFFKYLKSKNIITINPSTLLENSKHEETEIDYLTSCEILKIREFFKQNKDTFSNLRNELMFELFYSSGITLNELLNLDKTNFILNEREIHILKNSKRKILFFSEKVKNLYLKFDELKNDKFKNENITLIFVNNFGKKLTDRSIRRIIEKIGLEANLEKKLNPYMLRHTFCINLLKAEMPKEYLKKLLNLNNFETIHKYETLIKKEKL